MSDALYWHCLRCGAHKQVEPTGGSDDGYAVGDQEKCIDCGDGFCRVVTLRMGAAFEQGIALGMTRDAAWARAVERGKHERGEK